MSTAEAGRRRLHQPACQLAELVMRYPVLRHDLHRADSDLRWGWKSCCGGGGGGGSGGEVGGEGGGG